jgi:hypothetical protein
VFPVEAPAGLFAQGAIVAVIKRNMCCKSNILPYYHILSAVISGTRFFDYFSRGLS